MKNSVDVGAAFPNPLLRWIPRPLSGSVTLLIALFVVTASWVVGPGTWLRSESITTVLVSTGLVGSIFLCFQFPIHIRHNTKVHMNSIPLYLIAVLLPPPFAALAAGIGMFAGEVSVLRQRGSEPGDITCQAGRWMLVTMLGSVVAHLPVFDAAYACVAAVPVLWLGDVLTAPLLLAPISGESPKRIVVALIREGGLVEGAEYLVGLLGALVARQEIWGLLLLCLPTVLVYMAFKRAKELHEGTRLLLEGMADTVDLRDPYTGGHSRRVTEFTTNILRDLGKTGPEVQLIKWSARVHDIGKIGLPDSVLMKPGRLTSEERVVMETHPEHGAELLRRYPDFARGVEIVRHHHERWDGQGYPHRLAGADIPFGARIIAVADSFDAMTSDRPYRRGMTIAQAAAVLRNGRGTQWDPALVDAFLLTIATDLNEILQPALHLVPDLSQSGPTIDANTA